MWSESNPKTLEFDFKASNMLLETCTSNYLKHNYLESHHPLLRQMVSDVNLSKELLDRTAKVEPRLARVAADVQPNFFETSRSTETTSDKVEADVVGSTPILKTRSNLPTFGCCLTKECLQLRAICLVIRGEGAEKD